MRFEIESWIWYAFAMGMIIARLISRTLLFRTPKALQTDDWIMGLFTTTCYTTLIATSNILSHSSSNLLPPNFNTTTLTPTSISQRTHGSKISIVVEQTQIAVIWSCKTCLLILYHRLTSSVAPTHHLAIKLLAFYVAISFLIMEILYFTTWCRPFSQYWAVPANSAQCTALTNHRITNAVFNISSDLAMLCIALPLFLRSLLPLKRKLILCGVFSLGVFVVLAAVLNKYYSFVRPYGGDWIVWYTREASTAVLVANLPFTWTLLRKMFNLGAFDEGGLPPRTYHSSRTAGGRRAYGRGTQESAEKQQKQTQKQGSRGEKSLSLIGSICTRKSEERGRTQQIPQNQQNQHGQISGSETTQHSDRGLLTEAIHPQDFAPSTLLASNNTDDIDIDIDIDIERGLPPTMVPTTPPYHHQHHHNQDPQHLTLHPNRPVSPVPSSRRTTHSVHVSPDGTGGYVTLPRRVHVHQGNTTSRASSIASSVRRPMSVEEGSLAGVSMSGSGGGGGVAGGGRSAADRRKRARLSG